MLQPLGISAEAEAVYVALTPLGTATCDQLAQYTSIPGADLTTRLEELRRLGLATESGGLWRTLSLPEAAKALRAQRMAELEMASVAAESLHSHLLAASQSKDDDSIRIVIGREAILSLNRDLCAAAQKEICMFDKPPYVEDRGPTPEELSEDAPEWQALDRGLRLRTIYHPGFDADRLRELALFASKGEESRTGPVPMKLIIVDAELAMIPSMRSYLPGHELRMSVVRHPLLVEALQWQFEAVWDSAVPIIASSYTESDPRRQMLMSLLMTGSTDQAIASNLGINVRSVRRWIAELMDELGVSTRLQLGAAMVRAEHVRSQTTHMREAG